MNIANPFARRFTSSGKLTVLTLTVLVMLTAAQTASAQYLISSRAGFINRVEGSVMIQRVGAEVSDAGQASLGTQMKDGDTLVTTDGSRAEVLLSPGSYIRLDENTKLRAVTTRFSQMSFEVLAGSVIAEISFEENTNIKGNNPLEITTPHGAVSMVKTGVYRIDVRNGFSNISARRGEFLLGGREAAMNKTAEKIAKERVVQLGGSGAASSLVQQISKMNKSAYDNLDEWSLARAETLAAAHRSALSRTSTANATGMGFLSSGWYFDPFYNCYTYIPYGRRFTSAYGFGFYNSLANCACGWSGYWNPYYGSGPYNSAGTGGGSSLNPSLTPRTRGESDRVNSFREVSVGRRVDVYEPGSAPTDFSRRMGEAVSSSESRSWGYGSASSNASFSSPSVDRGFGSSVSSGRIDSGSSRGVDSAPAASAPAASAPAASSGDSGGGRSSGGGSRTVQ
ncbi:MAG: FecR family protein [Blastocatellia bacterium]